ncbi:MAG: hypothetical protein QOE39_2011 [Bradyrhizobium sp.]|nr:hypothetical protein [Bradyrhizobium sp.]
MSMVGFPLLLIPLAIYNIIVFLMPGVSFAEPIVKLTLMSGAEWQVTLSDMLLALGILLLLLEVIKGARPGAKYLTDHLLSLIVCGGAIAEFLLWPRFGTSSYFLLAMLALADFLSGIALRARRGMQPALGSAVSKRGVRKPAAAAPEPQFDPVPAPVPVPSPAPAPSVPPAGSVAESVLRDHPEPTLAHPDVEVASTAPSPQVTSPGLQPGSSGSPPSPDTPPR